MAAHAASLGSTYESSEGWTLGIKLCGARDATQEQAQADAPTRHVRRTRTRPKLSTGNYSDKGLGVVFKTGTGVAGLTGMHGRSNTPRFSRPAPA